VHGEESDVLVVKSWGQAVRSGTEALTIVAPLSESVSSTFRENTERGDIRGDDRVSSLIGFRRALTFASMMWTSFLLIDAAVVRNLHAGTFAHFAFLRAAVLALFVLVVLRLHRSPTPSERFHTAADLITNAAAAVSIAIMCVEFRGLASPYVPGMCLVMLARTVTSQDPWKRGMVMTGVPLAAFMTVLFGSSAFYPPMAAQLHDPAAITTLLVNSAYVLGTYAFLVVGGHIVWSLRRQVFAARNLGRYRLKRRLASGGMGDVWVAYHPGLKRDVAVKILKPEEQARSESALGRFEREVRSTAELAHPNTVRVFDYGVTEDGLWYYVMELLEGETLAEHVMRVGPLPPARALHIVGQAARALAEAHERGIVHRDVKPENLFLTSLGGEHDFVKVIDFGIAKVASSDGTMTGTGWVMGTPAYMSPEVAMGDPADSRSDVYALGEVLYFLLCGRPPFQAENIAALVFAQVNEKVVPPSRLLGRSLPVDVEAVIMRALEKEPAARYATAAEFALALASCKLAGKWTFGHATEVARRSSRPPPSGTVEAALPYIDSLDVGSLAAPRVPQICLEETRDLPSQPAELRSRPAS
jgi:serine/threonine-protein kinase